MRSCKGSPPTATGERQLLYWLLVHHDTLLHDLVSEAKSVGISKTQRPVPKFYARALVIASCLTSTGMWLGCGLRQGGLTEGGVWPRSGNEENSIDWFHGINSGPDRKEKLEAVFAKWGTGDASYDRRVVEVVCACHGSDRYGGVHTDQVLREAIVKRIKERPEVLKQIWEHERRKHQDPSDPERVNTLAGCAEFAFERYREDDAKFYYLLLLASLASRPEIVTSLDDMPIDQAWQRAKDWMEANAARYRYDGQRMEYVLME